MSTSLRTTSAEPATAEPSRVADADLATALLDPEFRTFARRTQTEFAAFRTRYRFAMDEVLTKVSILRTEFLELHRYNPIEHIGSRVKSPQSILEKALRVGCGPTLEAIADEIRDVAGIRITCSFITDAYRLLDTLTSQDDVQVLQIKDYIAHPKPSGYKGLHAIVQIPVFLSTGRVDVPVEVQIRTAAMDFWAGLEHKMHYKYRGAVPPRLEEELLATARAAEQLDLRMELLHEEILALQPSTDTADADADALEEQVVLARLWELHRRRGDG